MESIQILIGIAILLVLLSAFVFVALALRASNRKLDRALQNEEIEKLGLLIGDTERRLNDTVLREISEMREKFGKALAETQHSLFKDVGQTLDGMSIRIAAELNQAKEQFAGTDKNLQVRFDTLRSQVQSTITDTVKTLDTRMGKSTDALDTRVVEFDKNLGERFDSLRNQLHTSLTATKEEIDKRLASGQLLNEELQKRLTDLHSSSQQMLEIGKDIRSLQDILSATKRRGELGQLLLENLLKDILPAEKWTSQHPIPGVGTVDAVIRLPNGIVPIDSKFPLESFKRLFEAEDEAGRKSAEKECLAAVKKHIGDVSKYINTNAGTLDFALMYIPSESIYYEIITNKAISEGDGGVAKFAADRRVFPVSPQMLYVYLQTVLMGLRGLQVEENARLIIDRLAALRKAYSSIQSSYETASKQLDHSRNNFEAIKREIDSLRAVIDSIEAIGEQV